MATYNDPTGSYDLALWTYNGSGATGVMVPASVSSPAMSPVTISGPTMSGA